MVDAVELVQALELGRRARRGTAADGPVVGGYHEADGVCGAVPGLAPEVITILTISSVMVMVMVGCCWV